MSKGVSFISSLDRGLDWSRSRGPKLPQKPQVMRFSCEREPLKGWRGAFQGCVGTSPVPWTTHAVGQQQVPGMKRAGPPFFSSSKFKSECHLTNRVSSKQRVYPRTPVEKAPNQTKKRPFCISAAFPGFKFGVAGSASGGTPLAAGRASFLEPGSFACWTGPRL